MENGGRAFGPSRADGDVASIQIRRLAGHLMWDDGPDFDRAPAHRGNARGQSQRFVHIFGFYQIVAAELLLGLGERTIGDQPLSLWHKDFVGRVCCLPNYLQSSVADGKVRPRIRPE
jgi:hypothetical protein